MEEERKVIRKYKPGDGVYQITEGGMSSSAAILAAVDAFLGGYLEEESNHLQDLWNRAYPDNPMSLEIYLETAFHGHTLFERTRNSIEIFELLEEDLRKAGYEELADEFHRVVTKSNNFQTLY